MLCSGVAGANMYFFCVKQLRLPPYAHTLMSLLCPSYDPTTSRFSIHFTWTLSWGTETVSPRASKKRATMSSKIMWVTMVEGARAGKIDDWMAGAVCCCWWWSGFLCMYLCMCKRLSWMYSVNILSADHPFLPQSHKWTQHIPARAHKHTSTFCLPLHVHDRITDDHVEGWRALRLRNDSAPARKTSVSVGWLIGWVSWLFRFVIIASTTLRGRARERMTLMNKDELNDHNITRCPPHHIFVTKAYQPNLPETRRRPPTLIHTHFTRSPTHTCTHTYTCTHKPSDLVGTAAVTEWTSRII